MLAHRGREDPRIIAYVLVNMAKPAKIAGVAWLVLDAGILLLSARRRIVTLPEQLTGEGR